MICLPPRIILLFLRTYQAEGGLHNCKKNFACNNCLWLGTDLQRPSGFICFFSAKYFNVLSYRFSVKFVLPICLHLWLWFRILQVYGFIKTGTMTFQIEMSCIRSMSIRTSNLFQNLTTWSFFCFQANCFSKQLPTCNVWFVPRTSTTISAEDFNHSFRFCFRCVVLCFLHFLL